MSNTLSISDIHIKNRVMFFTGNRKIIDHLIQEGKIAVYVEKNESGEFMIEEDKTGIISKIPYNKDDDILLKNLPNLV